MRVPARPVRRLVAAVFVLATLPAIASAQPTGPSDGAIDDARERVGLLGDDAEDARKRAQSAARELDAVEDELRRASAKLAQADEATRQAELAVEEARVEAEDLGRQLAASRGELADNRARLSDFARDAYKYGPRSTTPVVAAFERLASTDDPNAIADTLHMLEIVLGDSADLVEESLRLVQEGAALTAEARAAERRLRDELAVSVAARDDAAELHAQVTALVDEQMLALERQQQLVADTERQLDRAEDELRSLGDRREAAERARISGDVTSVGAGGGLVTVGGITVAASLAPSLEALLRAARADGIALGGSGYRSPEATARLRIINGCPDVYDSPASACRVPTARPGTSMHEQGLAVDFTWQGRTVCYPRRASSCRGNAAFDWLRANAGRFGLYVLDSEAWHWSTNGE